MSISLQARMSKDIAGHVSVIFALTIIPIAVVAGFAIDFQSVTTKKVKAQSSLDAAVIAGSRLMQTNVGENEVRKKVRQYFQAMIETNEGLIICEAPEVSIEDQNLNATTICSQQTTLSAIAGVNEVKFDINSASTFGIGKIDVAFVLDVSGSMIGPRTDALKVAATDAINELLPEEGGVSDLRVAMVSYNHSVNAGMFFEDATGEDEVRIHNYKHRGKNYELRYNTNCVFERKGNTKYTDDAPRYGSYMEAADYWGRYECRSTEPVPLTTDREVLLDYIESLDPSGGTDSHIGLTWGWYMISPKWKDILPTPPREYDEADSFKAVILMSDSDISNKSKNDENQGSSWGLRQVCKNMKEVGIKVYTVSFETPREGENVMEYCASGPSYYYDAKNGEQLKLAFKAISSEIAELRITE